MPIYRRISYLPITIHFLVILNIHFQVCQTLSLQKSIEISANLVSQILPRNLNKAVIPSVLQQMSNFQFVSQYASLLSFL